MLMKTLRRAWDSIADSPIEVALTVGSVLVMIGLWPDLGRRVMILPGVLLVYLAIGPYQSAVRRAK